MNGHCGGKAPGKLPLLVGDPVDVCPVVLGQEAAELAQLATDMINGIPVPGTPTPFVADLARLVEGWKIQIKEQREAAAGVTRGQ